MGCNINCGAGYWLFEAVINIIFLILILIIVNNPYKYWPIAQPVIKFILIFFIILLLITILFVLFGCFEDDFYGGQGCKEKKLKSCELKRLQNYDEEIEEELDESISTS